MNMKQLFAILVMLLSASILYAQDIITMRSGETINSKVVEVGTAEIRYYKSDNIDGPVYVTNKSDVVQIAYANGTKDVFNTQASTPNTQPDVYPRSYRRGISRPYVYPIIIPHIDLGHHRILGGHHGSHHRSHHGRHH